MTLLGIEVHSDELELLQQAADMYDWEIMETEMEPKFKEAALNFRDGKHSFACPRKDELNEDLQESFPFLDEMAESEVVESDRNPNGAGRKGQDFISYLKAFLLAPVLRVEQNSEAMSFGNNYRNPVNTGTPRDVHWDSPTLHPKWEVDAFLFSRKTLETGSGMW